MNDERNLNWNGCHNVRDLGGLATMDGGRTRCGAIIRADQLGNLTPVGKQQLLDYGVCTIIDLRSPAEIAESPSVIFTDNAHAPISKNLALVDQLQQIESRLGESQSWTDMYAIFLDHYPDSYARILRGIAAAPPGAVVFHCHSGKDRTGIVAALLLSLAGVEKEAIAADYAMSQERLWPAYEKMVAEAGGEENLGRWWRPDTAPETMLATLAHLDSSYGGTAAYLRQAGLDQEEIAGMKRMLAFDRESDR